MAEKNLKNIISLFLVTVICVLSFSACSQTEKPANNVMRVAMIADKADITDASFNWMIYSGCKRFAETNNIEFKHYRSPESNTDSFLSMIDVAINDDYNIVVCNGQQAGRALCIAATVNPDVKFIGIDITKESFSVKEDIPENVYLCTFKSGYSGFLAGYGAVKEGFRHFGFLGGVSVFSVMAYGYGYVQGIETAAKEMGINDVKIEYVYGNQFFGDTSITAYMDNWFYNKGVEIVFAAGGKIWTSVADSAKKYSKKIIGVDVDQKEEINKYAGQDMVLTSAILKLDVAAESTLEGILTGSWSEFGGKALSIGLQDSENPENNPVGLAGGSWSFQKFTKDDYKTVVNLLFNQKIPFSDDVSKEPVTTAVTVNYYGTVK